MIRRLLCSDCQPDRQHLPGEDQLTPRMIFSVARARQHYASRWNKVRHSISLMMPQEVQSAVSGRARHALEGALAGLQSHFPVQNDLAAIATPLDLESGLELCDRLAVGDDLSEVETTFEHCEHLVP